MTIYLQPNDKKCPHCGSDNIEQVDRITGYCVPLNRWNDYKKLELGSRIVHATTNSNNHNLTLNNIKGYKPMEERYVW